MRTTFFLLFLYVDCREPTFMLNDFLKRAFDTGIQSYHERKEKRIAETQAKKKKQGTYKTLYICELERSVCLFWYAIWSL